MHSQEQLSYSYLCTVKRKGITGSSCHKYNFCHDKSMLVIIMFILTKLLLQQIFVVCLSWQKWYLHYFVTTKAMFCHDKHMFVFVTTKMILALFCHNKSQVLSWQTHVHICHNKNDTCIILSQQKSCLSHVLVVTKLLSWQNYVCCDRSVAFVCLLSWQT